MKKRILTWLIISAMALSLCSCSEEGSSSKADSSSVPDTTTTTTTATATTTTTAEPEPEPQKEQLELDGYGMLDKAVAIDKSGNAMCVAKGAVNARFRDKYVDVFTIETIVDGSLIITCTLSENEVELGNDFSDGEGDGDNSYLENDRYIFKVDIKTGEILQEIKLKNFDEYVIFLDGGFTIKESDGENTVTNVYDYDFNKIYTTEREGGYGNFEVNHKCDKAYYVEDQVVYCLDFKTEDVKAISEYSDFAANSVDNVMSIGGKDYVSLTVLETDGKEYDCIIDAQTSDAYRLYTDMCYIDITENIFQMNVYDDSYNTDYVLISDEKDKLDKIELPESITYSLDYMLDDGRLFYSFRTADGLFVEVHDLETNKLVGSLTVSTDFFEPDEDKMKEVFGEDYDTDAFYDPTAYFMYGEPLFTGDNTVLLRFSNNLREEFYVLWEIGLEEGYTQLIEVSDEEILPQYVKEDEIDERFQFIQPTEPTGEFVSLRERADEIEKKYGIELEIASEATGVIVDFAMMPSDSYEHTSKALDIIDRELARYPEGFLTQIKHEEADLLRFYLTEDVITFSTSFESGGVCTTYEDEIVIALEVGDEPYLESSIHHELSHAIDIYVEDKLNNPEFSDGWDALNPQDDIWYSEGEAQLHELYIESFYSDIDTAGAYYVDDYGHTNATEDRARIFETVMSDGCYTVKFDEAPFLMAKLNFYAKSIREAFDGSENWGEVPWEKYMD